MNLLGFLLFLGYFFSIALAHNKLDSNLLPRPLILEYTTDNLKLGRIDEEEDIRLRCTSWRFAVEANNLMPWKRIPEECGGYVKDYLMNRGYIFDLERVANEAGVYARSVELGLDGKDVWVFDVDETLLSNLPYYAEHGFGLEVFDGHEFDKWVAKAMAPAMEFSLKLYNEVLGLGFKVILLTGRSEWQRSVTVDNLKIAGFQNWDKLILRSADDQGKSATLYKSEKRSEMVKEGYRILGNSGDQWSDLLGFSICNRSFKLPNPMYFIL
ncbi:HAD superfamily, subfamily IIIB acid phosphatase [Tasmannia lanceolata]|uniref:HAD superfamily, subfamily IIIB acid phosphatase n=1 Tax=Tasmannia lanceolata TaxID=3420 RepID=UPI0040646DA9